MLTGSPSGAPPARAGLRATLQSYVPVMVDENASHATEFD